MNAFDIKIGEKARDFIPGEVVDQLANMNENHNPVLIEIELKDMMK